jgi:hypothetical protein
LESHSAVELCPVIELTALHLGDPPHQFDVAMGSHPIPVRDVPLDVGEGIILGLGPKIRLGVCRKIGGVYFDDFHIADLMIRRGSDIFGPSMTSPRKFSEIFRRRAVSAG